MMRVEVAMDKSFRGTVADFADEHGLSMPMAYRTLMEAGLRSDDAGLVEIDSDSDDYNAEVGLPEELEDRLKETQV